MPAISMWRQHCGALVTAKSTPVENGAQFAKTSRKQASISMLRDRRAADAVESDGGATSSGMKFRKMRHRARLDNRKVRPILEK